ncbi:MFS transporter [Tsukamurella sp. 8F]|uniref:MFS transporter n=1 Tax=unclassified Tsukamurella TaxID=2633480 RepID=UPI0023BA35C9|nr:MULTISPECIES: MFS transporter [unclassified Tsukamurella]MDF0532221.1 MFS transporter [Tsukamurella sp. 8J]MDF0588074.1 MFS transporter [Tsukamurella sp. 8F]
MDGGGGSRVTAAEEAPPRSWVAAWCTWDWGSAAFNAVMTTFVFTVYLTSSVGKDLPGPVSATSWLSWSMAAAGFVVAVLAPVMGRRSDMAGNRKRSLGWWSLLVFLCTLGCFFVRDDYHYLWLGLILLAFGTVCYELSNVPYYAMLRQVSTPGTIGRVSGVGWACGYLGGIVLLLVCNFGFIAGDGGLLGLTTSDGLNIRLVAVLAALWFGLSALPVLLVLPREKPVAAPRLGIVGSYRDLFASIRELWRLDRNVVVFLVAQALFRDALAAVFTFGAVLGTTVYGMAASTVLIFGVVANVFAAAGAFVAGRFDDRYGPKPVIVVSLITMTVAGIALLLVSGEAMFWVFGLMLTIFVGPAQSSARSFLTRLTPPGHEGQMFGLYQTTGRAASFIAPTLFGAFIALFGADRAGIVGILIVLIAGLSVLLLVRPARDRALDAV